MIKEFFKNLKNSVKRYISDTLPRYCVSSKRLSILYYFVFDRSFDREIQAVLAGKISHKDEEKMSKVDYFILVRNTHRMEKGLLMRPRKDVFGKDYLTEMLNSYESIWKVQNEDMDNLQLKWFYDVLSEYFSVVNNEDPLIAKEKLRFDKLSAFVSKEPTKSIPYYRAHANQTDITFDEFFKLCKQRRSVRWFLNKPVDRNIIDQAILAANQSPSACNRQPFEFRIFDDPEIVKHIVDFPMGTSGYGKSIPVFIVIVGNLDAYFNERDRHIIYIDASLASMSLMFALETLGLGSCSINWPDIEFREQKMESFLHLEKHQRPIMCMGIGYPDPDGMVAYSEKRPLMHIRKYN